MKALLAKKTQTNKKKNNNPIWVIILLFVEVTVAGVKVWR